MGRGEEARGGGGRSGNAKDNRWGGELRVRRG